MVSSTAAEADQLATIVFSLHDIKPDVYLQVFEQAFHVHSLVLKSQSEFFYKYLDSPDKVPLGPLAELKYQWVTKVDEDGTWSLVAENEQTAGNVSNIVHLNPEGESAAFGILLQAMYCQPIVFACPEQLVLCTEMADYYRCLKSLSSALADALIRTPNMSYWVQRQSCTLLQVAHKLKHKLLFKECLVHVTGPWDIENLPRAKDLTDPVLIKIALRARDDIYQKIGRFEANLLHLAVKDYPYNWDKSSKKIRSMAMSTLHPGKCEIVLPAYYRALADAADKQDIPKDILRFLEPLTKNNLKFGNLDPGSFQAQGCYYDCFLCADIEDEDLPWIAGNSVN